MIEQDDRLAHEEVLLEAIFAKARFKRRPGTAFTDAVTDYRVAVEGRVRAEAAAEVERGRAVVEAARLVVAVAPAYFPGPRIYRLPDSVRQPMSLTMALDHLSDALDQSVGELPEERSDA